MTRLLTLPFCPRLLCVLFVFVFTTTGCQSFDHFVGGIGAHPGSYDLAGERVSLQLLTEEELDELLKKDYPDFIMPGSSGGTDSFAFAPLLPIFGAAAVDFGYQVFVDQVEAEKERYTQSFEGSRFVADFFYEEPEDKEIVAKYVGFVLRRITRDHSPSFVLICQFTKSTDRSLLIVSPLVLDVRSAKAKLVEDSVQNEIRIASWTMRRNEEGGISEVSSGLITWTQTVSLVSDEDEVLFFNGYRKDEDQVMLDIGVLAAPVMIGDNVEEAGRQDVTTSVMKLVVTVEQSDLTVARDAFARLESTLNDNEDDIKKTIIQFIGLEAEEAETEEQDSGTGPEEDESEGQDEGEE